MSDVRVGVLEAVLFAYRLFTGAGLYTGPPAGQECALPTEQELQPSPSDLITISQKTVLWIYLPISKKTS